MVDYFISICFNVSCNHLCACCRKLEAVLGYEFRSLELMKEACTHCSWPDQGVNCYQRLEFLGDAVIDLFITRFYLINYRCALWVLACRVSTTGIICIPLMHALRACMLGIESISISCVVSNLRQA